MTVPNKGFVIHLVRLRNEQRKISSRTYYRTVGEYRCYYNGALLNDEELQGASAEPRGPGDNSATGKNRGRRIEAGTYPLGTHGFPGSKYHTFKYNKHKKPFPGIYVHDTNVRIAILIHRGVGFKASVGCINLTKSLVGPHDDVGANNSFKHVDALIKYMAENLPDFPKTPGKRIPNARLIVEGEP